MSIALSGLTASQKKADTAASNIANVATTGALSSENGRLPYQAQTTTQATTDNGGVTASAQVKSPGFVPAYDPNSPFADENGLIGTPNVNLAEEIVTLKTAEIAYKANAKVIEAAQDMSDTLLKTFDEDA